MFRTSKKIFLITAFTASFMSCKKEEIADTLTGTYIESGSAIVVNEGAFMGNNASASFISRSGSVTNNIYELANGGAVLGDVFQSYTRIGNKGICILNNSKKLIVVDARTFKNVASIDDATRITYPRYAIGKDTTRVYVSNGSGTGTLVVVNLTNNTIAKTIAVGDGPEQMAIVGNSLYVANSGGFGVDSTVSVVNLTSETETQKIKVGDIPSRLVKDAQNNIWVLCLGQSDYDNYPLITKLSPSKLVKINTSTNTVEKSFTLVAAGAASYSGNLCIGDGGQTLYYSIDKSVFSMSIAAVAVPASPIITGREFYGLNANPFNNQLVGCYAPSFSQSGYVIRYNNNGTIIDSSRVGIGPNAVYFN